MVIILITLEPNIPHILHFCMKYQNWLNISFTLQTSALACHSYRNICFKLQMFAMIYRYCRNIGLKFKILAVRWQNISFQYFFKSIKDINTPRFVSYFKNYCLKSEFFPLVNITPIYIIFNQCS